MNRLIKRFALLSAALAVLQGCDGLYREDLENCYDGVSVALLVDPSIVDAAEASASAEAAVIYVFDSEGRFLERRETEVGKTELLMYRDAGELNVVGWINKVRTFGVTPFHSAVTRPDGMVTLHDLVTRAAADHEIPTDLFYGEVALTNPRTSFSVEHKDILATRRTGRANVTVLGLQNYAGVHDEDFYIVTGPTASAVDFFGEHHTYGAHHLPQAGFERVRNEDRFLAPNFNVMPTDEDIPMTVELWHRTSGPDGAPRLIYSTSRHDNTDGDGEEIRIETDRTTNILIDFRKGISIEIEQTAWNVIHSWDKTFN